MKIGFTYFSGTGITEQYVQIITDELKVHNHEVELQDITSFFIRSKAILPDYVDGYLFGFPTYGNRIPSVCKEWLLKQNIQTMKPGAIFFTYGGRAVGNIHEQTIKILDKLQISVQLSAEFLGAHTFNVAAGWDLMNDRPSIEDKENAKKFTQRLIKNFQNPQQKKLNFERSEKGEQADQVSGKIRWHLLLPSRTQESCQMCRLCEKICPTQAFDANSGTVNENLCIKCMKCIVSCPDKAISVPDLTKDFKVFLQKYKLDKKNLSMKKSKIFF